MTEILVRKGATILPRKPKMPMEWVGEYSRSGQLQAVYPDIKSASKHTGITPGKIKKCMDGKIPFIEETFYLPYDYTQSNESLVFNIQKREDSLIPPPDPKKADKIFQYDLEGNFIASYPNIVEASRVTGASQPGISQVITNKLGSTFGYVFFRFIEESEDERGERIKHKIGSLRVRKKADVNISDEQESDDLDSRIEVEVDNEQVENMDSIRETKKDEEQETPSLEDVKIVEIDEKKNKKTIESSKKKRRARKRLVDIYFFNEHGNYVKTFNDTTDVFHELGISSTTIRNVCEGISRSSNSGIFLLKSDFNSLEQAQKEVDSRLKKGRMPIRKNRLTVSQFTTDGQFVKEYDSIREATEELGLGYVQINQAINGYVKQVNGYVFLYNEDYKNRKEMKEDVLKRAKMKTSELKYYVRERKQKR